MIIRMPKTREPLERFFMHLKMDIFTNICLQNPWQLGRNN